MAVGCGVGPGSGVCASFAVGTGVSVGSGARVGSIVAVIPCLSARGDAGASLVGVVVLCFVLSDSRVACVSVTEMASATGGEMARSPPLHAMDESIAIDTSSTANTLMLPLPFPWRGMASPSPSFVQPCPSVHPHAPGLTPSKCLRGLAAIMRSTVDADTPSSCSLGMKLRLSQR